MFKPLQWLIHNLFHKGVFAEYLAFAFCPQVATAVEKWKSAIREAQTFSRMHVLLGMLDACIKWDMSAENARCKVCRKKGRFKQF